MIKRIFIVWAIITLMFAIAVNFNRVGVGAGMIVAIFASAALYPVVRNINIKSFGWRFLRAKKS